MILDVNLETLNEIRDKLIRNNKTLSVAESVTSGLLQFCFASVSNASDYFQGGITTYNLGQKCRHLGINAIHGMKCNCISEQTAKEMALNLIPLFSSDYGIAVTGYASFSPEDNIDDLFAWFCIAEKGKILLSKKISSKAPEGDDTQTLYAREIITAFNDILNRSSEITA